MTDYKIHLTVVVNTEDVPLDVNINAPLRAVAERALGKSESKDRALSDFDFKDANGKALNLAQKVGDTKIEDGATLYLTLKAGVTG